MIAAGRPATLPSASPFLFLIGSGQVMPAAGQVLHQAEEERQVLGRHPLLVEGQDVVAGRGVDQEVRVLDPLRDALVGQQLAELVAGQKARQFLRRDVGIDGHCNSSPYLAAIAVGCRPVKGNHDSGRIGHWTGPVRMPIFPALSSHP